MSSSDRSDTKATEPWVDGWRWDGVQFVRVDPQDATMSLDTLREIAALAGLHIIGETDKRVLEAMAEIEIEVLEYIRDKQSCAPPIFHPPCLAELARRSGT